MRKFEQSGLELTRSQEKKILIKKFTHPKNELNTSKATDSLNKT